MNVETKQVKLSALKMNPDNPRRIGNKEMERLVKSLQEFPDMLSIREIVVDETMTVLGGNMRLLALKKSGAKECTAKIVTGLTPEQKREFIIKDNAAFGDWDMDLLSSSWSDLPLVDWGVDLPEDWLVEEKTDPADAEPQIDRAEELNKTWRVKPGDLWQIGEHRLLCGDSTKKEDVERLMGEIKADMVFTDPPYGIGRGEGFEGFEGFGGFGKPIARRRHKNGEWDKTRPAGAAFEILLSLSDRVFIFGGNFFTDLLPQGNHWLVWDKNNTMPTFGDCELVWTNIKRDSVKKYSFQYNGLIGKEKDRLHPTQKPINLLIKMMNDYATGGEFVFDGFIGSGSTMIAAENLQMKCLGIEISASYCSVILQRMTDAFPGIEIKRLP